MHLICTLGVWTTSIATFSKCTWVLFLYFCLLGDVDFKEAEMRIKCSWNQLNQPCLFHAKDDWWVNQKYRYNGTFLSECKREFLKSALSRSKVHFDVSVRFRCALGILVWAGDLQPAQMSGYSHTVFSNWIRLNWVSSAWRLCNLNAARRLNVVKVCYWNI